MACKLNVIDRYKAKLSSDELVKFNKLEKFLDIRFKYHTTEEVINEVKSIIADKLPDYEMTIHRPDYVFGSYKNKGEDKGKMLTFFFSTYKINKEAKTVDVFIPKYTVGDKHPAGYVLVVNEESSDYRFTKGSKIRLFEDGAYDRIPVVKNRIESYKGYELINVNLDKVNKKKLDKVLNSVNKLTRMLGIPRDRIKFYLSRNGESEFTLGNLDANDLSSLYGVFNEPTGISYINLDTINIDGKSDKLTKEDLNAITIALGTIIHEYIGHAILGTDLESLWEGDTHLANDILKEIVDEMTSSENMELVKELYQEILDLENYGKAGSYQFSEELLVRFIERKFLEYLDAEERERKKLSVKMRRFFEKLKNILMKFMRRLFGDVFKDLDFGDDSPYGLWEDIKGVKGDSASEKLFRYLLKKADIGAKIYPRPVLHHDLDVAELDIRDEVVSKPYRLKVDDKLKLSAFKTNGKDLEEDPNENVYKDKKTGEKFYHITDEIRGALSLFLRSKGVNSFEDIANKRWGNRDKNEVLHTNYGPLNWNDYVKTLKEELDKSNIRGKIVHLMLRKALGGEHWDNGLQIQLDGFLNEIGHNEKIYNWVIERRDDILDALGTNYHHNLKDESTRDKIHFEQKFKIPELGYAGSIDMIIEKPNGTIYIVDLKTGYRFNDSYMEDPFLYGDVGSADEVLYATKRNKAALQEMFYAFGLLTNNPDTKIGGIYTLWMPSERAIGDPQFLQKIQVKPFIQMMEKVLSEAKSEGLRALKDKLGDTNYSKLFDHRTYNAGLSYTLDRELHQANLKNQDLLDLYMAKLREYVMYDLKPFSSRALEGAKTKAKAAAKVTEKILELLEKDPTIDLSLTSWNRDISIMSLGIGTKSTIPSAYVQIFDLMLRKQKQRALDRIDAYEKGFEKRLKPILENYYKRKGIIQKLHKYTFGNLGKVNTDELFEFAWYYVYNDEGEIIDRRFRTTDAHWKEAIKKYSYINESNVHIYRNFVDYINRTIGQFFVDELSTYGKALANKVVTYRGKTLRGDPMPITNLDLHNNTRPTRHTRKQPISWQYVSGFFPKVFKTIEEIHGPKNKLKEMYKRNFTFYLENTFDERNSTDEAIPMKYLGSLKLDAQPDFYSGNLEHIFSRFVRHYTLKEELDDVFAFGKGLQYYLDLKRDPDTFKNTIKWFDQAIQYHLRNIDLEDKAIREKSLKISANKLGKTLMKLMSIPALGLNLAGGLANAVYITFYTHKQSMVSSIVKKIRSKKYDEFYNLQGNETSFGMKDIKDAWVVVTGMIKDAMTGNLQKNKAYLLLKKFNYLPNNWDWAQSNEFLKTVGNKFFSLRTLYLFYSLPEEFIATLTMISQMKSMKVAAGPMKGKSIWDMYEVVTKKDPVDGTEIYVVDWVKDSKGNYISRGKIKTPQGLKDIYELTPAEINRLYLVYEMMHGGYRDEDRMFIQNNILGQIFIQFKKFLPNIIRQGAVASHDRAALGYWVPDTTVDNEGEVMKWVSGVMEGRWLVLAKSLAYYMNIKIKESDSGLENDRGAFSRIFGNLQIGSNENYAWDDLSAQQQEALVDAIQTLVLWGLMGVATPFMFGGKTDDPWYRWYKRIVGDMTAYYNVWEFSKNLANLTPVSFRKGYQLLDSSATVISATFAATILQDYDLAYTKDGHLRGFKQFIKQVPIAGGIVKSYEFITNGGDIEEALGLR